MSGRGPPRKGQREVKPLHGAAQQGFAADAAAYARGRPEYPPELLPWLRERLRMRPGTTAVDLGAGTGKFTRLLVQTGARVQAIEPVDAMRAQLIRTLPEVAAIAGVAQSIPLPTASADAVLCAQAFHWFAVPEALSEIHRVLRPGGALGLVWNVRDESCEWVAALSRIIAPYEGDTPRFDSGEWRRAFAGGLFSELEETSVRHEHAGPPREVIVDRVLSVSFIAALAAPDKERVAAQLANLIDTDPALRGRAQVAFPYRTVAYRTLRVPAS